MQSSADFSAEFSADLRKPSYGLPDLVLIHFLFDVPGLPHFKFGIGAGGVLQSLMEFACDGWLGAFAIALEVAPPAFSISAY